MNKHTPGPWQTGDSYLKTMSGGRPWMVRQIISKDINDDAQIAIVHASEVYEQDEELEANARLIAKAPEMFNLIKAAVENWEESYPEESDRPGLWLDFSEILTELKNNK